MLLQQIVLQRHDHFQVPEGEHDHMSRSDPFGHLPAVDRPYASAFTAQLFIPPTIPRILHVPRRFLSDLLAKKSGDHMEAHVDSRCNSS